ARRLPATRGNADNLDREDFRSGSYVQTFEFLALAGAQRDRFTLRGLGQASRLATQDDFAEELEGRPLAAVGGPTEGQQLILPRGQLLLQREIRVGGQLRVLKRSAGDDGAEEHVDDVGALGFRRRLLLGRGGSRAARGRACAARGCGFGRFCARARGGGLRAGFRRR